MQIPDDLICSLLNQHKEKGMEYFFTRYYKPLVIWATAFLNDLSQAEDLVQDFFVKLWEKGADFRLQPETLKPFLYTSVRNLSLDRLEKKDPLRNSANTDLLNNAWEEYDNFQDELIEKIKIEISQLPERSRQVVECVYLHGMSYKETAAYLKISIATVNTLLVNALKKIRQKYPPLKDISLLLFLISGGPKSGVKN